MTTCTIKTVLNLLNLKDIIGQFFPALSSSSVGSWHKQRWSRNPVSIPARQRSEPGLRAVLALLRGVRVARDGGSIFVSARRTKRDSRNRFGSGLERAVARTGMSGGDGNGVVVCEKSYMQRQLRNDSFGRLVPHTLLKTFKFLYVALALYWQLQYFFVVEPFCLFPLWWYSWRQPARRLAAPLPRQQPLA